MSLSRGSSQTTGQEKILSKIGPNKRWSILACFSYQGFCLLIFLLFLALIFAIIVAVTKTGLVEIPLFTTLFYHQPQPVEVVNAAASFSLENKIDLDNLTNSEVSLVFSQEELTTLVGQSDKFSQAQLAVEELEMELFALTPILSRDGYLTVRFIPKVKNQGLDFKITAVKIGNLSVPVFLANFSKNILLQFYEDKLMVLNNLKISKVEIKKGQLILTTRPLYILPNN